MYRSRTSTYKSITPRPLCLAHLGLLAVAGLLMALAPPPVRALERRPPDTRKPGAARARDRDQEKSIQGLSILPRPRRPLHVEIWTSRERYEIGDDVRVYFRVERDARVYIFNTDAAGRCTQIFPNPWDRDNWVEGGVAYAIPDSSYRLVATGPSGWETVEIAAYADREIYWREYHVFSPREPSFPDRPEGGRRMLQSLQKMESEETPLSPKRPQSSENVEEWEYKLSPEPSPTAPAESKPDESSKTNPKERLKPGGQKRLAPHSFQEEMSGKDAAREKSSRDWTREDEPGSDGTRQRKGHKETIQDEKTRRDEKARKDSVRDEKAFKDSIRGEKSRKDSTRDKKSYEGSVQDEMEKDSSRLAVRPMPPIPRLPPGHRRVSPAYGWDSARFVVEDRFNDDEWLWRQPPMRPRPPSFPYNPIPPFQPYY